jgi:hypothetical protein
MRVKLLLALLALCLCCISRGEDATLRTGGTNTFHHGWEYIYYPQTNYEGTNLLYFLVNPNAEGHALGLNIMTYSVKSPSMLKKGNVSAQLHRANGQVVDIDQKFRGSFEHALGYSSGSSPRWRHELFPHGDVPVGHEYVGRKLV